MQGCGVPLNSLPLVDKAKNTIGTHCMMMMASAECILYDDSELAKKESLLAPSMASNSISDASNKKKKKGRPQGKIDQQTRLRSARIDLTVCKLDLLKVFFFSHKHYLNWRIDNEVFNCVFFIFIVFLFYIFIYIFKWMMVDGCRLELGMP